jgi:hypothetical protein
VEQLEASSRYSATFNQPQYLHLKESLSDVVDSLDKLQVTKEESLLLQPPLQQKAFRQCISAQQAAEDVTATAICTNRQCAHSHS